MLSLFIIIYIARIMIIYSSSRYMRCYHLYLSSCLALLIVNRESYRLILRFVINHALSSLMWWIDSMSSFWSRLSISSWLHMSKSCENVFFIFFVWNEICKSELSHSNKAAKYLSVKEIIFCKIMKLLLSWIVESLNILVSSKIANKYSIWLKILNVHVMLINKLWHHAQHHQFMNMKKTFYHWIHCICLRTCKLQYQILNSDCIEQKEKICKTMTLYDHESEIFLSAFHIEHTTRFLHCKMRCSQSFHIYWVFLDLRSYESTKILNFKDYVQCVFMIWVWWQSNQSSQSLIFCQCTQKVAAYLLWDQSSTRSWFNSRSKIMKCQLTESF